MRHSTGYIFLFAGAICIICAIVVCLSEVSLSALHENNARFDKQKNVLYAAGLARPGENLSSEDVRLRFERVRAIAIHVEDGEPAPGIDPDLYDARKAAVDPKAGRSAPPNASAIKRMARHAVIYHILENSGEVGMIVLPIEGYGLWGTLYGFLALDADAKTVLGLTYYQHKETPGLGGEVDNPDWKALWPGRVAFDGGGEVAIEVIKGHAGPPVNDPHRVDGLSGATITSRGVTNMLHFWLGENGFGPYLKKFRGDQS